MVKFSHSMSWIRHLKARRGNRLFHQAVTMFRFHMTPFYKILQRIFTTLDECDAKFTFPIVATTASSNSELVEWMKVFPHEIAVHGYKHVRYPFLSLTQQAFEFKNAIQLFEEMKIPFNGFRAPYNAYSETTINLLEKFKFNWDAGIGYRPNHRRSHDFFKVILRNGKKSSYTCIPLSVWSDDLMIDKYKLSSEKIASILIYQLEKARKVNGVIMFDLHPIRIGQKKYIQSLKRFLLYAKKIDAWIPTVSEAVNYWSKFQRWKGNAPVCCLLTGDIDNFTFFDYMRRI